MFVEKSKYRFDFVEEFPSLFPTLFFDAEIVQFAAGTRKNTGNGRTNTCGPHKVGRQHFHMIAVQDRNPAAARAHEFTGDDRSNCRICLGNIGVEKLLDLEFGHGDPFSIRQG